MRDLNAHKVATSPQTSTLTSRIFAVLFPGSPAVNALLATLYISGPPNFLLALCPPNIDPSSLSVMVAFAVGGLLGDTLFHLLPEIFLGEDSPEHVRFVLVEPNRNLLLGVAIMVGFVTFVAMDKGLRIATGGEGGHDHSHGNIEVAKPAGSSTALADAPGGKVKSRKGKKSIDSEELVVVQEKEINASVKLAGYLNLMCVTFIYATRRILTVSQRRLYSQHNRWPCYVFFILCISHYRGHHDRCCLLSRNPARGRRFCTLDSIWIFEAQGHGCTIHYCIGSTSRYMYRYRCPGIRRKWRGQCQW